MDTESRMLEPLSTSSQIRVEDQCFLSYSPMGGQFAGQLSLVDLVQL